jgi:superfamily II DNA helicase RecQ
MVQLGNSLWEDGHPNSSKHARVAMYTADTRPTIRASILSNLADPNSCLKVVICTTALSLGVDTKNITLVLHYGCPKLFIDYVQQAGRAGRELQASIVRVLVFKRQLTEPTIPTPTSIEPAMRNYLLARTCRRVQIGAYLGDESAAVEFSSQTLRCCDICDKTSPFLELQDISDDMNGSETEDSDSGSVSNASEESSEQREKSENDAESIDENQDD